MVRPYFFLLKLFSSHFLSPATERLPSKGMGERILPEGFVEFVSTVAPAWEADGRPIYGGFFWINGTESYPIPKNAYYMAGAGGQMTIIIPSHDLVVVKLSHYKGEEAGRTALRNSLKILMEAVPESGTIGSV